MKAQELIQTDISSLTDTELQILRAQIVEKDNSYRGRIRHIETAIKSLKNKLNILKCKRTDLESKKLEVEKLQFERAGKIKKTAITKGSKKTDLSNAIKLLASLSQEEINELLRG